LTTLDHRSSAAAGFTLIELMIAVAILGLIMVMLAGSFHAVAMGKTQGENHLAIDQQSRSLIWEMSNEIRGTVYTSILSSPVVVVGVGRMENNNPLDTLSISTLDPGHRRTIEDFGDADTVSYTTAPNPKRRGCFLLYRTQANTLLTLDIGSNKSAMPVLLADNLLSLHFRYFDGNNWVESWDSESLPPGRQLPQAISIELVLAQPSGAPMRLSTITTLPMAMQQW